MMLDDRRRFILLGGSTLCAPALAFAQNSTTAVPSLKKLANNRWAVSSYLKNPNKHAAEERRVKHHCDTVTSEFGLKPKHLFKGSIENCVRFEKSLASVDMKAADHAANFGLNYHLHAVYWPRHSDENCVYSKRNLKSYLSKIAPKSHRAVSADVLNEVFKKVNENSPWKRLDNPDFDNADQLGHLLSDKIPGKDGSTKIEFLTEVVRLFHHVAGSNVDMLINEDQLSWYGTSFEHKRRAVLALVMHINKRLEKENIAMKGIGLQGHLIEGMKLPRAQLSRYASDLDNYGYDLHISEFDIKRKTAVKEKCTDEQRSKETAEKTLSRKFDQESSNANQAAEFFSTLLVHKNVVRTGFWGLSDSESVMTNKDSTLYVTGASPTLYDINGQPKPILFAIADVFTKVDR